MPNSEALADFVPEDIAIKEGIEVFKLWRKEAGAPASDEDINDYWYSAAYRLGQYIYLNIAERTERFGAAGQLPTRWLKTALGNRLERSKLLRKVLSRLIIEGVARARFIASIG